ncbi:C40 family peptidase [Xenorhabdus bovienii]|uniref:C40 family peptidase n=1 Tax=Xenorhabdus bovienii TaxID=40576 RepID=UPI0023B2E116|nr:C40 family peptidase [Xenorhabdus bovienii]MDE9492694.1 C40 family peptidase [Xenorhabdus bovienii]MDE9501221.1 C40 family peptidase [Xenorhabdus bovienii]MDE9526400.1 C40 family peptidase [Xenorhabdus bovienii]MDE9557166.1 C40 family peptidase [Xenorhabdus bovienii]MDE9569828.1 C40 family peptidase [Xenorhabdus bovienii]
MTILRKSTTRAIMAHAQSTYPDECCGLIIQQHRRQHYLPCRNTALSPTEQFSIHPEDYAAAEDKGSIIAIVHSHPDATTQPSQLDIAQCDLSQIPWVIVSWPEGDIRTLMPIEGIKPLIGRPFVHGIWDCYAIVRDWFRLERTIELPDFERTDSWWVRGENLYMKQYSAAGFVACRGELQTGDVIIMQVQANEPNHAAIYLGDSLMLHHLYGQLSKREPYHGYWQERTIITLRHSSASADFLFRGVTS